MSNHLYLINPDFLGMACFAWNNANENNTSIGRRDYEAAGALGVMCICTGILYLIDFFYVIFQKALIGDADADDY